MSLAPLLSTVSTGSAAPLAALPTVALLYVRVSTTEQAADGVSLATQTAVTRRYAAERGMQIGHQYQDILSGRRDDRPQYQAMLAEARRLAAEGRRVVIVVAWLHRLGRRLLEQVRAREELEGLGAAVHAANDGGEVAPFVANILASVAEQQAQDVSVQVAGVARETRERGWLTNVPAIWGYVRRPSTLEERGQGALQSTLDVAPQEAPYVAQAFERAATGETIHSIARWIATLPEEARGGRALTYSIVRWLLHNPIYIRRQPRPVPSRPRAPGSGGKRLTRARPESRLSPAQVLMQPEGRWPRLISDELWLRAQAAIDQHRRVPRQAQGAYLLTGLVFCPVCGARMGGATLRNRERRSDGSEAVYSTRRYVCQSAQHAGTARPRPCRYSVHGDSLEASAVAQVAEVLARFAGRDGRALLEKGYAARRRAEGEGAAVVAARTRRLAALDTRQEKARALIVAGTEKYVQDRLPEAAYQALVTKQEADIAAAEGERRQILAEADAGAAAGAAALPPLKAFLAELPSWQAQLTAAQEAGAAGERGDAPEAAEARRVLRAPLVALIERIVPRRLGYKRVVADVEWTPQGQRLRSLAG